MSPCRPSGMSASDATFRKYRPLNDERVGDYTLSIAAVCFLRQVYLTIVYFYGLWLWERTNTRVGPHRDLIIRTRSILGSLSISPALSRRQRCHTTLGS